MLRCTGGESGQDLLPCVTMRVLRRKGRVFYTFLLSYLLILLIPVLMSVLLFNRAQTIVNTESNRANQLLLTQMNNGAFRSREPSKAFFVDVSEQINTPTVIFAGKLIARIGLATNKPAEFIVLSISQDTRALEAELAAAGA